MINTAYPIDAVVTWDESFVPDGAQKCSVGDRVA